LGTLVHAVLERLEYGSAEPLARQVESAPELAALNATQRRQAARTLARAAERLAQELDGAAPEDVLREVPFVARFEHDGARVLADGKLDLLFRRGTAWTLVDYKVTQDPPKRLLERYGLQLALYRDAVSEPCGQAGQRRVVFGGEAGEFRTVIAALRRDAKIELVPVDAGAYPDVARRVVSAARELRWMTGRSG
jgi:ATP-dependent exoDNAse (exonuclease V) beta subunit